MTHETPSQAEHVIDKLGGINAAARLLGHRSASTVQGWKQRGFIPANRQREVFMVAAAAGIALTKEDFVVHLLTEGAGAPHAATDEIDGAGCDLPARDGEAA